MMRLPIIQKERLMKLRLLALFGALAIASPALAQTSYIPMPLVTKSGANVNADGVVLVYTPPATWADGATINATAGFSLVEVQVRGISGGDAITFTRGLDNTGFPPLTGFYDQSGGGPYTTVTADGVYSLRGGGFIQRSKAGSASTPVVTYRMAQ